MHILASPGLYVPVRTFHPGLTLVHFSAQRKRFLWDKGCFGGVEGLFMAGLEGVRRRSGDVLSVRTGSG